MILFRILLSGISLLEMINCRKYLICAMMMAWSSGSAQIEAFGIKESIEIADSLHLIQFTLGKADSLQRISLIRWDKNSLNLYEMQFACHPASLTRTSEFGKTNNALAAKLNRKHKFKYKIKSGKQ